MKIATQKERPFAVNSLGLQYPVKHPISIMRSPVSSNEKLQNQLIFCSLPIGLSRSNQVEFIIRIQSALPEAERSRRT